MVCCDAMVKRAAVTVLESRAVSPGKHLVLVNGGEAEVFEAMQIGREIAAGFLIGELYLPYAHPMLARGLSQNAHPVTPDAVGIIELHTVAGALLSADAACKAANVELVRLRTASGIGGKAYYTVVGDLAEVQAACEAGISILADGILINHEIVARPHEDFFVTL